MPGLGRPGGFFLKEQCGAGKEGEKRPLNRAIRRTRTLYSEAAAIEPVNKRQKEKLKEKNGDAAIPGGAPVEACACNTRHNLGGTGPDGSCASADCLDSITAREFARARQPRGLPEPARLGTEDFDATGDARTLFDQVAQRFGLRRSTMANIRRRGASDPLPDFRRRLSRRTARSGSDDEFFRDPALLPLCSWWRRILPRSVTIWNKPSLSRFRFLAALTTQELTEISQAVKQATNIDKLGWDTSQSEVVMRDRFPRVLPAQALLQQLVSWRPEVMIELEFLEVSDSGLRQLRIQRYESVPRNLSRTDSEQCNHVSIRAHVTER